MRYFLKCIIQRKKRERSRDRRGLAAGRLQRHLASHLAKRRGLRGRALPRLAHCTSVISDKVDYGYIIVRILNISSARVCGATLSGGRLCILIFLEPERILYYALRTNRYERISLSGSPSSLPPPQRSSPMIPSSHHRRSPSHPLTPPAPSSPHAPL